MDFEFKNVKLRTIIEALSDKMPIVRVGILGSKNKIHRPEGNKIGTIKSEKKMTAEEKAAALTNAELGAIHEFGGPKTPVRSFLRMPLTLMLEKNLEAKGAFEDSVLVEIMETKSLKPYMKDVALVAEETIDDAFDSNGFGNWKESDMSKKENHQTLDETGQLRKSITSEVI